MKINAPNKNIPELVSFNILAMGCQIQVNLNITSLSLLCSKIEIEQHTALLASDVQQKLTYWEHIFSRFDDSSELMRLNNHTDQWRDVSAELFEVLQRAIQFVPKTQGLVTPTLLQSLWAAGYKHSFETLPKLSMPTVPVIDPSATLNINSTAKESFQDTPVVNYDNQNIERIQLRRLADGQYQVYLPAGMALDLNGYVKGWCAMQLAEYISQIHDWQIPCLVDMGGDIAIGMPKHQGTDVAITPIAWGVAIAKPYIIDSKQKQVHDDEDVAILKIRSGAVATSGQDYRRWWYDGRWQHHLIHPHYSRPVTSDVLTATVLATDTMTAEVYAKYCVMLGLKAAMAWLNKNHIAALLIDFDNKVMATSALDPYLVKPNLIASIGA
ncbi:FAD:protein FMN transferase [Psychrobacter urativorans]|uniref:FAD:protein FMN transferase n=1 Tax=Psychrobacter urativorans TaxID=45610 RepID=A0A0M3V8A0_9GAMM|nr:FAD:protein FMN transferase [Psychrobacter urativorans]ALF58803.1 thiamine biosynthesis protein ApbE [Psychrobacter urativorans]